jgi:hypothetical protein
VPNPLAIRHLLVRLRPVNRALRAAVDRQAAIAAQLDRPDLVPYCVTDEQVNVLLDQLDALALPDCPRQASLTPAEQTAEQQVREEASAAGMTLPLDELTGRLELTDDEQHALLLCTAPELDRAYERVIAYILDDLNRRFPCVELLTVVTAGSGLGCLTQRGVMARTGRLRLLGLLVPYGEAPTDLRQELRVSAGVVNFLLGNGGDLTVLAHDPGAVPIPATIAVPPQLDMAHIESLGRAIRAGDLDLVGVWGPLRIGQHEIVYALAQAAGMPLRQVDGTDIDAALNLAAALDSILWLRTDELEPASAVTDLLTRSRTPVCLSGSEPWRPAAVVSARAYAEIAVAPPSYRDRKAMWTRVLPELDADTAASLAARYQLSEKELRAVATLAGRDSLCSTNRCLPGNGHGLNGNVAQAVTAVTRGPVTGLAHAITPRRPPEDLVLPPAEYQMVLELASACRAWPRVAEEWGFAAHGGTGGLKALFTGDPGTGKTLAAEVIAGMVGLTLLKVDLSQVVSKWVGETEKNLESVFRQAEESQALLFFDEADALFGKRGEVKHGMDRWANLEVGFLLQRLEAFEGLVILASNLRENIDPAFTRRFSAVVHFPRPGRSDRRRLWRLAFPPEAPLAEDVDFETLAQLDLTGAGIVSVARTAALLAAEANAEAVTMAHAVQGLSRQYQREARVLRPTDLGRHAALLDAAHA